MKRINILIGPQAAGKSVCAKLLYYFKGFIDEIFSAAVNQQNKREFDKALRNKFEEYFPLSSLSRDAFSVRYEVENSYIEVSKPASTLQLNYSDHFYKQLAYARKLAIPVTDSVGVERRHFLAREVWDPLRENANSDLGNTAGYSQRFVPAGRSFFSVIQANAFTLLSANQAIDPFIVEFGKFYESIYPLLGYQGAGSRDIDIIVEDILSGTPVYEKGKVFLDHSDGRRINIVNSSSGQQEVLPLAVLLRELPRIYEPVGSSIYIEEPEAHLFPTAQKRIVELLATVFNSAKSPVQFIITTHSPYILTALNNLLQAGDLADKLAGADIKKLDAIVPPSQRLKPEDVSVYSLSNGTGESICCEATGLISTNIIDEVSNDLSIQFGQLLDLE